MRRGRTDATGPRIVLLNDARDQISVGSNALTDGLVEILFRSLPDAQIRPIPSHWLVEKSAHYAFVDGGVGLAQPRAKFPQVADQFETVADEWLEGSGGRDAGVYLRLFDDAELVVLNGEGSLYRSNQSAIRELFLAWMCKTRLGIPTVFVNGGLHLTGVLPVLPAMVRKTFRELDAIALREPRSYRNFEEYVPGVRASLVPDAAFVFSEDDAAPNDAVASVLERMNGEPFFCFDPGAMPMDVRGGKRSALYELITTLQDIVPRSVFLSHSPPDDYIEQIAEETGSLYVDSVRDYRAFMALASSAEFIVTGRHHNVILAAIMGCPSIAFGATTHKVHGVCEWLDGLVRPPFDGTDLRTQLVAIDACARAYVADRDELRTGLLSRSERLRGETLQLGRLAADALRAGRDRSAPALPGRGPRR